MVIRLVFATLVFALAMPSLAQARTVCAERESMITQLKKQFGESERGVGLSGQKALVEIWSSEETGTWTIVMTRPNGIACVMASGQSWIDAPADKGPET